MSTVTGSSSPAAETLVAGRKATARGQEADEYRRGFGDGIVWATEYATADELRDLVENFGPRRSGDFDNPHWRGFVAGAEVALDDAGAAGT